MKTRPSVDYAKVWLDQSYRFPIWAPLQSRLIWYYIVKGANKRDKDKSKYIDMEIGGEIELELDIVDSFKCVVF